MRRRRIAMLSGLAASCVLAGAALTAEQPSITAAAGATSTTIGSRIRLDISVRLPDGWVLEAEGIGPDLGDFRVLRGSWRSEADGGGPDRPSSQWRWEGEIAPFATGEVRVPSIRVAVIGPDGAVTLATDPIAIRVDSVLPDDADHDELDIADLKDPASIAPDFGALRVALVALAVLLAVAFALWWAMRRWADRFAAAPTPPDPFDRLEPHEWAFRELQRLLERRLHEDGRVDDFHAELSRIVKRYLEGRFRVDLLERTTGEVADALRQGDVARDRIHETTALLGRCDTVKFAGHRPAAQECRLRVEEAYRLVDATRPAAATRAEVVP